MSLAHCNRCGRSVPGNMSGEPYKHNCRIIGPATDTDDTLRMNWLERNRLIASIVWRYVDGTFTLRMAVDFAMGLENVDGRIMRDEWLRVTGLQPRITAFSCPQRCEHVMDSERTFDNVISKACSKCGATAFDISMMEMP